jgi:hypothetical protein
MEAERKADNSLIILFWIERSRYSKPFEVIACFFGLYPVPDVENIAMKK